MVRPTPCLQNARWVLSAAAKRWGRGERAVIKPLPTWYLSAHSSYTFATAVRFALRSQNDCVPSKVVAMKGSRVACRPYVVLVDPFSTGAMLAPELDQRGETQVQLEAEKSM